MRYHGTCHTSNIATQETDASLSELAVIVFLASQLLVDETDSLLKRRELAHGVWNLPAPERHDAGIELCDATLSGRLSPRIPQVARIGRYCRLHPNFQGFKRAQEDVGNELGRGGCAQENNGAVHVGKEGVPVDVLEHFIKTILAHALEGIADKGW